MSKIIYTIRIQFSEDRITLIKSDTTSAASPAFKKDEIKLVLSVSKLFHKTLNKTELIKIFEKNDFEVLGNVLFEIVCRYDAVRAFLLENLSLVTRDKQAQNRCRILLEFDENTYDLAALPWEYLLIEDQKKNIPKFYIGADKNKQFDVARLISNPLPYTNKIDDRGCLNVITVTVNPHDKNIKVQVNETRLTETLETVRKRFMKKTENGEEINHFSQYAIPSESLHFKEPFVEGLKYALEICEGNPYILHFFGHARLENDKSEIALLKDNEEAHWIDCEDFASVFEEPDILKPELVILQACESGRINSKGQGLAVNLLRAGIPAVVAMQNEVNIETSLAFVEKLYDALLRGYDVAEAVTIGRTFLGCEYNNPDNIKEKQYVNNAFGTPLLVLSSVNPLQLMPSLQQTETSKEAQIYQCPRCKKKYPNPRFEYCQFGACRGVKLVLFKEEPQGSDVAKPNYEKPKADIDELNLATINPASAQNN